MYVPLCCTVCSTEFQTPASNPTEILEHRTRLPVSYIGSCDVTNRTNLASHQFLVKIARIFSEVECNLERNNHKFVTFLVVGIYN